MRHRGIYLSIVCLLLCAQPQYAATLSYVKQLEEQIPTTAEQCTVAVAENIAASSKAIEKAAAAQIWSDQRATPDQLLARIRELIESKRRIDQSLDAVLALRTQFVEHPPGPQRRQWIRHFLRITAQLIDLSGRTRALLVDSISSGAFGLSYYPQHLATLIDELSENKIAVGASAMSYVLVDPPPGSQFQPFPVESKKKVLRLIAETRHTELLPNLATFVAQPGLTPDLLLDGIDVIREIGLPQDPIPGQDAPDPPITADKLREQLLAMGTQQLAPELRRRYDDHMSWLTMRCERGITGDVFQFDRFELRAGDWLLMRNPSPYNSFTDLAPGLFTHVGVVSEQTDEQGIRRFVIVDLLERGDRIPATTVDAYLQRTLHFFFVRHVDPSIGQQMGEAAASMIGNETEFDLTFQTDKVLALKGKPLQGQRINTYCAGFLLLCAQQTAAPKEEFFPIPEYPAGGNCLDNLAQLGLSIGDNFISPTGALFSPRMQIVARREPVYSPGRDVKEYVYDYFAESMVRLKLNPAPDLFQTMRTTLAGLANDIPWLARTLARSNNVSEYMDLEAAARAAAVIETLDQIADASMNGFDNARQAMVAGPDNQLPQRGFKPEEIQRIREYRQRHEDLFTRWMQRSISPLELRIELVQYYQAEGKSALEAQFFTTAAE